MLHKPTAKTRIIARQEKPTRPTKTTVKTSKKTVTSKVPEKET